MKSFVIQRDTISGQFKGCAFALHVRYTRFLWCPSWASKRDVPIVHLRLFAPSHDPDKGYACTRFGLRVRA